MTMEITEDIFVTKSAYHSFISFFSPLERNLLFTGNQSCGKLNFAMLIVDDVESTIAVPE
jgi:hypothetical protein